MKLRSYLFMEPTSTNICEYTILAEGYNGGLLIGFELRLIDNK